MKVEERGHKVRERRHQVRERRPAWYQQPHGAVEHPEGHREVAGDPGGDAFPRSTLPTRGVFTRAVLLRRDVCPRTAVLALS